VAGQVGPAQTIQTTSYAITTDPVEIHPGGLGRLTPAALLGDVRIKVTPADGDPLFMGIASESDARTFLTAVDHTTLIDFDGRNPVYRENPGGPVSTLPTEADIWAVSTQGVGTQTLTCTPQPGDWVMVVMDEHGQAGITADASVGAQVPAFGYLLGALFITGYTVLIVGAVFLLAAPARTRRGEQQ
jgi:hypothetical protein